MFGPPCYGCGSEFDWFPNDGDGDRCQCGWPEKKKSTFEVRADIGDLPFHFGNFYSEEDARRVAKTIMGSYVAIKTT